MGPHAKELNLSLHSMRSCLYLLLVGVETFKVMLREGLDYAMPIPAIVFTIHAGLGWGLVRQSVGR